LYIGEAFDHVEERGPLHFQLHWEREEVGKNRKNEKADTGRRTERLKPAKKAADPITTSLLNSQMALRVYLLSYSRRDEI